MTGVFVGVDVGTGGVRVGAFDCQGRMRGQGQAAIRSWRPRPDFVEQSSEDIWRATARAMGQCLAAGRLKARDVRGIAFDATCSLVALGANGRPITVSPTGRPSRNVILWMDHRAAQEAETINATRHKVLRYVGGRISPEMETPKLLWLKKNLKETWRDAAKFMDLADFMVFKACGNDVRSVCTTVCKWTYLGHDGPSGRYDRSFFRRIGLADLFDSEKVPLVSRPIGGLAGELTVASAKHLGLAAGTPVGVGIIDAHAGGIGLLGPVLGGAEGQGEPFDRAIALIGGTSSCHMAVSGSPRFIPGVWGPYHGAMIPGMWLNEGGQSATGSLLDYTIRDNAAYPQLVKAARAEGLDVYAWLNRELSKLKAERGPGVLGNLHMLPDHHGNRSPRADPSARGMVSGLTLNTTARETALWYGATLQAIAYGTRHIVEAMNAKGYRVSQIYMCGGHLKNEVFIQEHADVTGCDMVIPQEPEAVLLGAAILAATAAGEHADVPAAMRAMSRAGRVYRPDPATEKFHQEKYAVYQEMFRFQNRIHKRMAGVS